MIHNQEVNNDLLGRGIKFIMDTDGNQFIPWEELQKDDVVIIPAFGTTVEIERLLRDKGIEVQKYNTTCPFVEKVWNRSQKLGDEDYTIIIHGKPRHEETRATFSHTTQSGRAIIVRDLNDARRLADYMTDKKDSASFYREFSGNYSDGFNPKLDLQRVGVVNQTTMLASETQAIADFFRNVMSEQYGVENLSQHFADTRDTLCYATNDNQEATYKLLETDADLAIVVGGYNSSNTSHIVELCENKFPTYFINSDKAIKSSTEIHHFNYHDKTTRVTENFLPATEPVKIVLTSGASCPDTVVDNVMLRVLEFYKSSRKLEDLMEEIGAI
jgi:4-hydroxy-3-methylbut-2-enyl diphosphate reductase